MGKTKQALAGNKNRSWEGGEMLPMGTACLLKISDEKNSIGVKDLCHCSWPLGCNPVWEKRGCR
jgi:hypothetical protein